MSSVDMEKEAFSCKKNGDYAVITLKLLAQKIITTTQARNDLISHLSLIADSSEIKGLALINSIQYPGDEEYKHVLHDILPDTPDEQRKRMLLTYRSAICQLVETILDSRIPIVAGMEGNIGPDSLGLYMAFDFRIASQNTVFINPNLQFGFLPASLLSFFLVKNIGPAKAMELILSNQEFNVKKAYDLGLISQIADDGNVETKCIEKLKELKSLPSYTVFGTRRLLQPDITEIQTYIDSVFDRSNRYLYKIERNNYGK